MTETPSVSDTSNQACQTLTAVTSELKRLQSSEETYKRDYWKASGEAREAKAEVEQLHRDIVRVEKENEWLRGIIEGFALGANNRRRDH